MEGIWLKRCPHCGSYIRKKDPWDSGVCSRCGWHEKPDSWFGETKSFSRFRLRMGHG